MGSHWGLWNQIFKLNSTIHINTQFKVLMSTEGVNLSFERCQFVSSLGYFDTSSFKLDRNIRLASIRCWPLFFLSSPSHHHTLIFLLKGSTLFFCLPSSFFCLLSNPHHCNFVEKFCQWALAPYQWEVMRRMRTKTKHKNCHLNSMQKNILKLNAKRPKL